jgi:16S rRNA pseudouridine516 synthase
MNMIRLDKLLSDAGWGSRHDMRRAIARGTVTVDGVVCFQADKKIMPNIPIFIDGQDADYRRHDYIMMHKPAGVVSATEDESLSTVVSLLPARYQRRGLFPAGRLDRDSTGLLILTNDGAWAHTVTSPGHHVEKVYETLVDGPLDDRDRDAFAAGLTLQSGVSFSPAALEILSSGDTSLARVTIAEGKYHQIKRMMAARGRTVLSLKRISIGRLALDETLAPGAWRFLSDEERVLVGWNQL